MNQYDRAIESTRKQGGKPERPGRAEEGAVSQGFGGETGAWGARKGKDAGPEQGSGMGVARRGHPGKAGNRSAGWWEGLPSKGRSNRRPRGHRPAEGPRARRGQELRPGARSCPEERAAALRSDPGPPQRPGSGRRRPRGRGRPAAGGQDGGG